MPGAPLGDGAYGFHTVFGAVLAALCQGMILGEMAGSDRAICKHVTQAFAVEQGLESIYVCFAQVLYQTCLDYDRN